MLCASFVVQSCTGNFISSQSMWALLSSSHLIPSPLTYHLKNSTVFISSEHWSTFPISSKLFSTHLSCSARQKALTVREKSLAQKNIGRRKFLHTDTWDTDAFTYESLSEILCTTKLAQSTSQYHFVLQSLHKALPSTTLYYKACTKHVPVLLCNTKLAQSTSQYYYVLQSLHKALWSVKCKCEVWSVKCEECSVKCPESFRLVLHCAGVARRSCSWTTSV